MRGAERRPCTGRAWLAGAALLALVAGKASAAGDGVRFVYLIRHGDYTRAANADDTKANGLNELGKLQADLLGKRLAALGGPIHALVSSDFTRARETADVIGRALGLTPTRDARIHECVPRESDPRPGAGPEPSDQAACESNLAAAYASYFRPAPANDERDVLVCHGNVIRWMVRRALGVSTTGWRSLDVANAALTVIAVRPDGTTSLISFNDVGHLPPERQTWLGPGPGWTRTAR